MTPDEMVERRLSRDATASSDRGFGLTIGAVLLAYAAYSHVRGGRGVPAAIAGGVLLAVAILYPRALHRPNVLWTRLGRAMERIVNPVVLGVLWVVVLTPIALLMRLTGRDPLRRRIERGAASYWVQREEPPAADSWSQQF
ncbi:MAG: hypothetical protein HOQ09_08880 [Gemmatimonadaceae bacterium]|nr:hypothetical protein [Gemmatimonadaceae bacterium]